MTIYRFDNPLGLLFLIFPVLCIISMILSKFVFKKGARITGAGSLSQSFSLLKIGYILSIILTIIGLLLIAVSLAKPQSGIKKEKIVSDGVDIMIALDVSYSMTTPDFMGQRRIEGAKKIITEFIDKRAGDRLGLVIFGESSFLKCPATLNHDLLKKSIAKIFISPDKKSSGSTAIGVGLASAVNRLINLKDNTKPESKMVILVTDGSNNTGEISPETALDIAIQSQIKVYTVAVGSSEDVDVDLLSKIADKSGAKFFHANTSGELGTVFDEIDKLEKHKIESMEYTRFKDMGFNFVLAGLIIMFLGIVSNILFFKRLG